MKSVLLLFALLAFVAVPGCVHAPPNLSPAGIAAFNGTRVIKALDVIRDIAIDANAQQPALISTATTRKIVIFHESALRTIKEVPGGWVTTVIAGLTELARNLPPQERQQLAPYIVLAQTVLREVAR